MLLRGNHTCLLIAGTDGWLTESCRDEVCVIIDPALNRFTPNPFRLLHIRRILIKKNVKTLVANSAAAGVFARLLAPLLSKRVKVIYVSHGWSALYNAPITRSALIIIERALSLFTDLIINVSESDHKKCSAIIKPYSSYIQLPNKVPKPKPSAPAKQGGPIKVVFVGRMSHPKRQDLLIQAFSNLDHNKMQLTLVGDGENFKKLKAAAQNNPAISFLGEIKNFDQYDQYHIFCLISDSEGLPMAALEAKALGIPLLLSNTGGCPELISKYGNGLLCKNSASDITRCLNELADNLAAFTDSAKKAAPEAWLEPYADQYIHAYTNR